MKLKKKIKNLTGNSDKYFFSLTMIFLKRDVYFVKCFFSFSERVKNEGRGKTKDLRTKIV